MNNKLSYRSEKRRTFGRKCQYTEEILQTSKKQLFSKITMDDIVIIKPNYSLNQSLQRSFAQAIYYPILIGECGHKYYLLDGYLRYQFAKQHQLRPQFSVITFTDLQELLHSIIVVNTAIRELHLLEKAYLLDFAANNQLPTNWHSLLKMKINEEIVCQAQKLIAIPVAYFDILQRYKLSFSKIAPLLYFDNQELLQLLPFFENCRFSQSNFVIFLEALQHFTRIHAVEVEQLLMNPTVSDIVYGGLSPCAKGERLIRFFLVKTKPLYYRSLDKINVVKARLQAQSPIEIDFNPNFENNFYRLILKIARHNDILDARQAIADYDHELTTILEIMHGED